MSSGYKSREKCSTCGGDMFKARTLQGRLMPIDIDPNPKGNLILQEEDNDARGPLAIYVGKPDPDALFDEYKGRRYMTHFATCPQAADHRRKK